MTKTSPMLYALVAMLAASRAHAADPDYCAALPELASTVKDCQQNVFFVKAADACELKLQKDIAAQQSLLTAAMLLANAAAASSQTGRITNSNADLDRMRATLEDLETKAKRARENMLTYSRNFTLPGPISRSVAIRLHMEKFLAGFHCYSDNQTLLGLTVKDVDHHLADFSKALSSSEMLAITNRTNLKKLDAGSLNAKAHGKSEDKAPAVSVPDGTDRTPASDLTGTGKDKKSDQEFDELFKK